MEGLECRGLTTKVERCLKCCEILKHIFSFLLSTSCQTLWVFCGVCRSYSHLCLNMYVRDQQRGKYHMPERKCVHVCTHSLPSCLHTTSASSSPHSSLHTNPHAPPRYTSTRPSSLERPPCRRTEPG